MDFRRRPTLPVYDHYELKKIPKIEVEPKRSLLTAINEHFRSTKLPDAIIYSDWSFSKTG